MRKWQEREETRKRLEKLDFQESQQHKIKSLNQQIKKSKKPSFLRQIFFKKAKPKLEKPKKSVSDIVAPHLASKSFTITQNQPQRFLPKSKIISKPRISYFKFLVILKPAIIGLLLVFLVFGVSAGTLYSQTEDYSKILSLADKENIFYQDIGIFKNYQKVFSELLGENGQKKYLVIFQNPAEARPSGGFMGNFGIISFKKGNITEFWVKDIYTVRDRMPGAKDPKIASPTGYSRISKYQKFSESNWFADFPTSAQNIQKIYAEYNGWKTDGVIAIDPVMFIKLLEFSGPIEMSEYKTTFNSENFWQELHEKIEVDNDFKKGKSTETPKKILHDLVPKIFQKISALSFEEKIEVAKVLLEQARQKHFTIYFNNYSAQEAILKLGFAGELKNNIGDYLNVVKTNQDNKSSYKVDQKVSLVSNLNAAGILENELTIQHINNAESQFPEGPHYCYLMIYLPQNAEFNSGIILSNNKQVKPFEYKENGKKVWTIKDFITLPKESNVIKIKYSVDIGLKQSSVNNLSFLFQKQLGMIKNDFNYRLTLDPKWEFELDDQQAAGAKISKNQILYNNQNLENDLMIDFGINNN